MTPTRIAVGPPAAPHYHVEIGAGLLSRLDALIDAQGLGPRRLAVSTAPIWQVVQPLLAPSFARLQPLLLPDGERFKVLPTVARAYDALVRAGADRGTVVVAVGGGVLGDMAGFVAATFLRGLPLVHVPTTLLAQVDSAIGGKVGVNLPQGKNLVGAFYRPRAVVADSDVLQTLPRREFRAGLYEVVKYAVIASPALFDLLCDDLSAVFARKPDVVGRVVADCCRIKARVVTEDEREAGTRRILNFGHTAGHALEAITRYRRFRHGEAVAYGMLTAAHLSVERRALADADRDRLARLIAQMGPLPPVADLSVSEALEAMRRDKKVVDGRLHFVLPTAIGRVTTVSDVTEEELAEALGRTGLRG
jgi:3-dehydroquinate synthase